MKFIISFLILCLILGYLSGSFLNAAIFIIILSFVIITLSFILNRKNVITDEKSKDETDLNVTKYTNCASKTTTYVSQINSYEIYHRPSDNFIDNMNYRLYRCKGIYVQTNRKRTINIEAFDDTDAMEQLRQAGFIEPFEIVRISFPEITDAQKEALGNIYLGDVCKYDASRILSRQYDKDSVPNPELISYATECHIKFSYYIGKKALYDLIFNTLDLKDKIAFFVFCVYRYTTDDRKGNLNTHPYRDLFYKFAEENMSNESFVKSMSKYDGNQLRFFGTLTTNNGISYYGGSKSTIAYKTAIGFLKQHFLLAH